MEEVQKPNSDILQKKKRSVKTQNVLTATVKDLNQNIEFISSNPEQLQYTKANISITVLGGISLAGLERLKVTLKISNQSNHYHPLRQHLDLYNTEQVQKLLQWCTVQLDLNSILVEEALQELIAHLENYRALRMGAVPQPVSLPITAKEREEAIAYLNDENLMQNTFDDLAKTGIIGEEENRMIMFLVFLSRLLPEPLHIISFGASGSGKTYLQEKLALLVPEEHKIEITSFSANALYYFKSEELQNKLLLIEDMDGAQNVLYPLRELQSKQKLTKVISLKDQKGEIKKQTYIAQGAVCVAGCTTKENIYEDNANRSILIHINNGPQQDARVIHYQQQVAAGYINKKEEEKWQRLFLNIQRMISTVEVRNPYAPFLQLPSSVPNPRRSNKMYLKFIEVITLYNSHQRLANRDKEKERFIKTTVEDIEWANRLLKPVLIKKSDELSAANRHFLERLKKYLNENTQEHFTCKEIREALKTPYSSTKRRLLQLSQNGYLKIAGGSKLHGYIYSVVDTKEYVRLKEKIWEELDTIVENIKQGKNKSTDGPFQLTDAVSHPGH